MQINFKQKKVLIEFTKPNLKYSLPVNLKSLNCVGTALLGTMLIGDWLVPAQVE